MPQFPFHSANDDPSVQSNAPAAPSELNEVESDASKKDREPLKFKSVEPKGPVNRVRIKSGSSSSKSSSKKSPFKESGLFEDAETIVKFRDDFGKPFALTVLVVGVVALIYWFSLPADDSDKLDKEIAPLLVQADELSNKNPASLNDRISLFKDRTQLADKLIAFKSRKDAVDRGAELKLKTLTTWETLNLENNQPDSEVSDNLESTSRQFINSRNSSVARLAQVGLMLIRINGHMQNPDPKFFPEILDQFSLVSTKLKENITSAENLVKIANCFESKGLNNEANQLFRVIDMSFSTSHNSEIASLGLQAKGRLNNASSLFVQLKAMAPNRKKLDMNQIKTTIGANSARGSVTTAKMDSILEFLEYMASNNFINETRELMDGLADSIFFIDAGIERTSIKKKYDSLLKRVSMVGETFNFEGLFSVQGRPISRGNLKLSNKMVVFWSPDNQKSVEFINQLSGKHKIFNNRRIQVIAIANVNGDDDQQKIVNMSNNTKGIEFLTLQLGRSESQAFITRTPIPKLPYWILLNRQNLVQALNASSQELGIDNS